MFSGIVEVLGSVESVSPRPPGVRLVVRAPAVAEGTSVGESIAVNGCCLTVVELDAELLGFDVGSETLSRTNLGRLAAGSGINLERSLRLGQPVSGHLVTGHIDDVGSLDRRHDEQEWSTFWIRTDPRLTRQMASKGSIAVDGVSLTLVDVEPERFSVALIPHTLQQTTLGRAEPRDVVNLETDILAKYVERQTNG